VEGRESCLVGARGALWRGGGCTAQTTAIKPRTDAFSLSSIPSADHIHIRIQQRNGRKTITTLQGVPTEYDPKKLLKAFKSALLISPLLFPFFGEKASLTFPIPRPQRSSLATVRSLSTRRWARVRFRFLYLSPSFPPVEMSELRGCC
jgi:hypothetical protein